MVSCFFLWKVCNLIRALNHIIFIVSCVSHGVARMKGRNPKTLLQLSIPLWKILATCNNKPPKSKPCREEKLIYLQISTRKSMVVLNNHVRIEFLPFSVFDSHSDGGKNNSRQNTDRTTPSWQSSGLANQFDIRHDLHPTRHDPK